MKANKLLAQLQTILKHTSYILLAFIILVTGYSGTKLVIRISQGYEPSFIIHRKLHAIEDTEKTM